jgi:hypothetical protein
MTHREKMNVTSTTGVTGLTRAKLIAVTALLVSYGALGARQPAVRASVPLPVPAAELAASLGLDPGDRSHLLISIVRLVFDAPDGHGAGDLRRRFVLASKLKTPAPARGDRVPLPLDTSIWRETLLHRRAGDGEIAAAILSERPTALLYHGLAAMDDETLGWLGPDRETLLHLRTNAAVFAAFGRSVRVRAGRVAVPGGADAEPLWAAIVGADPARPSAFVQRLVRGNGRLAWFYDTVQHLDREQQRALLAGRVPDAERIERLRELLDLFQAAAPEWRIAERPFVRPALDPSLVLPLLAVSADGGLAGPAHRRVWDVVFRDGASGVPRAESADQAAVDNARVNPAWLIRRISLAPVPLGRRRLETFLLAQRVFAKTHGDDAALLPALRGAFAFPALALTLERMGVRAVEDYAAAARAAAALNAVRSSEWRRVAIAEFQSVVAILDRSVRTGGLDRSTARALLASLAALPITAERGFGGAFAEWLRREFVPSLPPIADTDSPVESAILSACAGFRGGVAAAPIVEWEGRRYRADPAAAELARLRTIRERQRDGTRGAGATLDRRLAAASSAPGTDDARLAVEVALADTLMAIVYAVTVGERDGAAVSGGAAAAPHDFGTADAAVPTRHAAWQVPREERGERGGWRIVGALLGLDVSLARLPRRRADGTDVPRELTERTLNASERAGVMRTAALFGPVAAGDTARDEIAAAIARGRARVGALTGSRAELEGVARDAGLSEWRREALGWTLEHERGNSLSRFSLLELFWLGSPRGGPARGFDRWGASTVTLDGCLCLRMPDAAPWESRAGRASAGHLATRGADVTLRVAEFLSEQKLPASLAPAIAASAMQDVIDVARPAFVDDWPAFQRAARDLPRDRLIGYVSAAVAGGALVPIADPPAVADQAADRAGARAPRR